jgi:hypothetical protein
MKGFQFSGGEVSFQVPVPVYFFLAKAPFYWCFVSRLLRRDLRQSISSWAFNNKSILNSKKEIYGMNL